MEISEWISDHINLLPVKGFVLDLACGGGRHTRYLASLGYNVTAVDIDISKLEVSPLLNVTTMQADLEKDTWPFDEGAFDAVIVTNYLWRPLFPKLVSSLKLGGIILYETFAAGNEKYGRPSNPEFLLAEGELLQLFTRLEILDYYHSIVEKPKLAVKQAIAAKRI